MTAGTDEWDTERTERLYGKLWGSAFEEAILSMLSKGAELPAPARPDLVEELLKQIQPVPGREADCRAKIVKQAGTIRKIAAEGDVFCPAAIKAEIEQFNLALSKVRLLMHGLSPVARNLIFDGVQYGLLSDEIEDVLHPLFGVNWDITKGSSEKIEIPLAFRGRKGAPPKRFSKLFAASNTKLLIQNFSARPPTLTKDGPFLRGAQLLFQAANGERSDLTRYCRYVLAHTRPKNL
jgi:hypothetical protein